MKEEIAFEIMKQLKKDGHKVAMEDQPKTCVQFPVGQMPVAIVGSADLTTEAVKACTDYIRTKLCRQEAPYTIERAGDKNRFFPKSSFAAW